MDVSDASFGDVKAMSCPLMLFTMTVIRDSVAESMAVVVKESRWVVTAKL